MKKFTIFSFLILLSSNCYSEATEWERRDLYVDGSKSALDGDCLTAITQLFAFKEFNKSLLEVHKNTRKTIDFAIEKCLAKIQEKRKIEYVFLPTEKDCSDGSSTVSSLGMSETPKVKYRIVRKKGNPRGMEFPEYDVMFDLETSRSKVSYPLVPSFYDKGEFKMYGSSMNKFGKDAASEPEAKFSTDILKQYMKSNNSKVESYMIDPSSFNEVMQSPSPAFR